MAGNLSVPGRKGPQTFGLKADAIKEAIPSFVSCLQGRGFNMNETDVAVPSRKPGDLGAQQLKFPGQVSGAGPAMFEKDLGTKSRYHEERK